MAGRCTSSMGQVSSLLASSCAVGVKLSDVAGPKERQEQDHQIWVEKQIKRADAIIVCSAREEIKDVQEWITRIRKMSSRYIPIILAGTAGSWSQESLSGSSVSTKRESRKLKGFARP